MSQYRFSENKEHNAEVIREMVAYLRNSFQVYTVPTGQLVDVAALEQFADKVENGDII